MGACASGFKEVHGGHVYRVWNTEGKRVLEFAMANDLISGNTRFLKRVTPGHKSQIDYILYCKSFSKSLLDVKVIAGEECALQYHLLVFDFNVSIPKFSKQVQIMDLKLEV